MYQLPNFSCQNPGFIVTKSTKYYIHPEKIVIQPWKGQHHVYAIFMLPKTYLHDSLITVNLPNNQTFCGTVLNAGKSTNGITAQPGYLLLKGYLQTRTTLKYIFAGRINDIKKVENWQLGYIKNEK